MRVGGFSSETLPLNRMKNSKFINGDVILDGLANRFKRWPYSRDVSAFQPIRGHMKRFLSPNSMRFLFFHLNLFFGFMDYLIIS